MRALKPCVRTLRRFLGWYVRFVDINYSPSFIHYFS